MRKQKNTKYKIPTVTKEQKKKRAIGEILMVLLPCLILFLCMRFVFIIGVVPSLSMYPLMDDGYGMIANRISYEIGAPSRGDVVVFKKGNTHMTKRIIGIPGDTVAIQNGLVYINKQPIVETYLAEENSTQPLNGVNYYEVPDGKYFVLGDNRTDSNDSRAWDDPFVSRKNIEAKVVCVFNINPFKKGFVYKDVEKISIMETNSGAAAFDDANVVEGTTNEAGEVGGAISSTLPVVTIAPEVIEETEAVETEAVETDENGEVIMPDQMEPAPEQDGVDAAESNEGLVAEEN